MSHFFCDLTVPRVHTGDSGKLRSDVREAWQRLNSVALHHVSREMRGRRAWPRGQRPPSRSLWALIELQTSEPTDTSVCDERLCWLIWKPKERLFICQCQAFKIRTKRRRRRKRTSVRLIFARESCEALWQQRVSSSFVVDRRGIVHDTTFPCCNTYINCVCSEVFCEFLWVPWCFFGHNCPPSLPKNLCKHLSLPLWHFTPTKPSGTKCLQYDTRALTFIFLHPSTLSSFHCYRSSYCL